MRQHCDNCVCYEFFITRYVIISSSSPNQSHHLMMMRLVSSMLHFVTSYKLSWVTMIGCYDLMREVVISWYNMLWWVNMIDCDELICRVAALIWQLMRAYTLSVLTRLANTGSPIIEKEIVQWVNNKLQSAGKTSSIKSFQVCTVFINIPEEYLCQFISLIIQ